LERRQNPATSSEKVLRYLKVNFLVSQLVCWYGFDHRRRVALPA
jgi:hypothetical protein